MSYLERLSNIPSLIINNFFQFPNLGKHSESSKLLWIYRLRRAAIVLFIFMLVPGYFFEYLDSTSASIYGLTLLIAYILNTSLKNKFIKTDSPVSPFFNAFQLSIDLVFLTFLLLVSKGVENPLSALFILHAALGGILIRSRYAWTFALLCHIFLLSLQLQYLSIHRNDFQNQIFLQFLVTHFLIFSAWIVMRSLGEFWEEHFELLAQSKVNLEKRDRLRALGALAAGFSHEFASPLNAAKLQIDRLERVLTENKTSQEILEDLNDVKSSIASCSSIIQSMNSAQLDVRNQDIKKLPLKEFFYDIVSSWNELHPQTLVQLHGEVTIIIAASPINLAQVIINLLDNAEDAHSGGPIHLYFQIVNKWVHISFEDQGPGFSESILEKMGEPFLTTKENGTGLGLYVSEIFAQSMGGTLEIMNKNPRGARVTLKWPELTHFENKDH